VVGRHVFYNDSHFDAGRAQLDSADLGAVAPDKQALLPGQIATAANYTSFDKGLSGIAVDVADLPEGVALEASDFRFRTGNDDHPNGWADAPAPLDIHVYRGAGDEGSDRVLLGWEGPRVRGAWLEVTVKPTDRTGLDAEDVFLFGNAPGESGNSPDNAYVDGMDFALARDRATTTAAIDNPYDYNRDGRVDEGDRQLVVDNPTNLATCLKLLNLTSYVPSSGRAGMMPVSGNALATDTSGIPLAAHTQAAAYDAVFARGVAEADQPALLPGDQPLLPGDQPLLPADGPLLPAAAWAWLSEFDFGRPSRRKSSKDSAQQAAVAHVLAIMGE